MADFAGGDAVRDHHDHAVAGLLRPAQAAWMSVAILLRVQVVLRLLGRSFSFQLQAGIETLSEPSRFFVEQSEEPQPSRGVSADGQLRLAASLSESAFKNNGALALILTLLLVSVFLSSR